MNRENSYRSFFFILLLVGVLLVPAGCGTLEVRMEQPTATAASSAGPTSVSVADLPTVPPTATPSPPPTSAPSPVPPTSAPTAPPATATPAVSVQPTAVPTQASTATLPPTAAPTLMGTPVVCDQVPIRGFGVVWADHAEVRQRLGCPQYYYYCAAGYCSGEQPMVSAVQRFEHGTMIWVNVPSWEGSLWVYALFADGSYQRFSDTWVEGVDPISDTAIVAPEGLYQPIRGFGKVWREGTGAQVRERLGWAIEPERGGDGAYQVFQRGIMYWLGPVDRIYVLYEYDADYDPLHIYQEFTDTF